MIPILAGVAFVGLFALWVILPRMFIQKQK